LVFAKEAFDAFLEWLDTDRDLAGQRYEQIRAGLIRVFVSKGHSDADYLADETLDRVVKRLPDIRAGYVGDPNKYIHGVARNILLEASRRKEIATDHLPERVVQPARGAADYECLMSCLQLLPSEKRELILDYYLYQGSAKIEHHRKMAVELHITEGALRTRAHHLRAALERCVLGCLNKTSHS
jgi:DNA-directed RNA polymerase specialized sigma24 family protein